MTPTTRELLAAAREFLILNPVPRHPTGAPHSPVREEQDEKIAAYDRLKAAVRAADAA